MKRFLSLLMIAVIAFSSCKEDKPSDPQMNFGKKLYVLPASTPLEVDLNLDVAAVTTLTVPVTVSGSAVEDQDYTLSAKQFVFAPGATKATITITPKNNVADDRTINLSVGAVDGYQPGSQSSTIVTVETKETVMYGFNSSKNRVLGELKLYIYLTGEQTGSAYKAPEDVVIPLEILATSTALSSEYTITDNATSIVIRKDSRMGFVTLKLADLNNGNKVLNIKANTPTENAAMYSPGQFGTISIDLYKLTIADLIGRWKPVEITNKEVFEEYEISTSEYVGLLPENNGADDYIEFTGTESNASITTSLTGDLKTFFLGADPHSLVFDRINWYDYGMTDMYELPYYTISGVNKFFSKTQTEAADLNIGFVLEDENTLSVYFIDYVPTDFFVTSYEDWGFDDEMFGIVYKFTRVLPD